MRLKTPETLDFLSLSRKKTTSTDSNKSVPKFAILSDCALEPFSKFLKILFSEQGVDILTIEFSMQPFEVAMNSKELIEFEPDFILFLSSDAALRERHRLDSKNFLRQELERWKKIWSNSIDKFPNARIIQTNFALPEEWAQSPLSLANPDTLTAAIFAINSEFASISFSNRDLTVIDVARLSACWGEKFWHDRRFWYTAKQPCSMQALGPLAWEVVRTWAASENQIKCVITDFDDTLWGGSVGELGVENIELGGSGAGEAYVDYQHFLLQIRKQGVLLAGCTRNELEIAKAPFISHPAMALKWDDLYPIQAVQGSKAEALEYIRKTLNISWSSIIFIDDSPFEREMARALYPELHVPELPGDPAQRIGFLYGQTWFMSLRPTSDDKLRPNRVREEGLRTSLKAKSQSMLEFLSELQIQAKVFPLQAEHVSRVHDLFLRTNQYNWNPSRPSESEILSWLQSKKFRLFGLKLKDKIGDYGLVSIALVDLNSRTIESLLMSCRVAGRGIEEHFAAKIFELTDTKDSPLKIKVKAGERNKPAYQALSKMGFQMATKEDTIQVWEMANKVSGPQWIGHYE